MKKEIRDPRQKEVEIMTMIETKGRILTEGKAEGTIIGTNVPLSFWGGFNPATGVVVDRHHPLCGVSLANHILVLPKGRGSCSGSGVLLDAIVSGHAPSAILLAEADEIVALGSIVAEEVFSMKLPIIVLDEGSFEQALLASTACIEEDGIVVLRY